MDAFSLHHGVGAGSRTTAGNGVILRVCVRHAFQIRDSIVVSISACHVEDPGSIPGRGKFFQAPSKSEPARP